MNSISLISINNAEKIGYSSSFELFDGSIVFNRKSQFTLTTIFSNINNQNGSIISFEEINELQNLEDYNYISVNGVILKRAKIISFNIDEGNFNKNAVVKIVLEILEDGDDLSSLQGYYQDYASGFLKVCSFVDNISESVSISNGENSISFSKQVDIKFSNSVLLQGVGNPVVNQAQIFAKAIFDYDKLNGYNTIPDINSEQLIRSILNKNFKRFTTETINIITNECSFTEQLEAENIKSQNGVNYSHSATQSISIGQDGIVTVTENGSIKALQGFYSDHNNQAEQAYQNELQNAKTRLNDIFLKYYECQPRRELNKESGLIKFLTISKEIDKYKGTISYTFSASNDKKYENIGSANPVFYTTTLSYDINNNIWTAKEVGTIEGMINNKYNGVAFGLNKFPKFNIAYNFYLNISSSSIYDRISSFMQSSGCTDTISPNFISRSDTYELLNGVLKYERTLSTNKKYIYNNQYKSVEVSKSIKYPYIKKNEFAILKEPIYIQPTAGQEQGSESINVNLIGYRVKNNQGKQNLISMKNYSISLANSVKDSNNNHIKSASQNYSYLNDVNSSFSIEYYNGLSSP